MSVDPQTSEALEKRRIESAKGETTGFLEALARSKDPDLRRRFRGMIGAWSKVFFPDESR